MTRSLKRSVAAGVPAARQIPYRAHIAVDVVSTAAGDCVRAWRLSGRSFECADDVEVNVAHERLNAWLRNLAGPEVALWTHTIRRREHVGPQAAGESGFSERLGRRYRQRLADETLWVNELYLTLVYRPLRLGRARGLLALLRGDGDGGHAAERGESLRAVRVYADQVEAALVDYEPVRLGAYVDGGQMRSSLLEFLALLVNGEWQRMPVPRAPIDRVMATSRLLVGWETIEYRMATRTRYGACLGIKEYPTPTSPGMINRLLRAPFPYLLTQSFTFLAKSTAMGLLSRQWHRLRNAADPALSQAEALRHALDRLASNEFAMGDHHLSLQVLTEPRDSTRDDARLALRELERSLATARAWLSEAGMVVAREDLALEAAFWAQLPAQFAARPRRAPITTRNFAGLAPFHNFPTGREHHNFWGDALAVLKTSAGSPYHFSLHASDPRDPDGGSRRDTGHTFICGPTGSGKTVFIGFCVSHLVRLGATQVIFDKDRGLEILVRALGGEYLTFHHGSATGCNPLQLPDTADNRAFLRAWLSTLVHRPGHALSVHEEADLDQALAGVLELSAADRRLSRLLEFLDPTKIDGPHARLSPWCLSTGGELGCVFDHGDDRITPLLGSAPIVGFDMTDVVDDPVLRRPLTQYLFHLLDSLLDGRRLVAWLDEFSKLIGDEGFRLLAADATKTWRKRNGVMAFATQGTADVLATPLARALIEQTPTKVFFPNADASREGYVDGFGLTEREFDLIRTELSPGSRRFLIKQGRESVVAELDLKGFDAELKVISGRSASVEELERLIAELGAAPASWLPTFMGESNVDGGRAS
jgi:type IV secretion system protein VirB4